MYMNRFIIGFLVGVVMSVWIIWCICTMDLRKCSMFRKNKKWAKRVMNIY